MKLHSIRKGKVMKTVFCLLLIILLSISAPFDVYAGELEEAELRLKNVELESQLLHVGQQLLRYKAKEIQARINYLKSKAEIKNEEEKQR